MTLLQKIEKGLWALCFTAGAYGLFVFLSLAWIKLHYPYGVGLGEAPVFQAAESLRNGAWPYHDLHSPPFSLVPYGPVYLLLAGFFQNFFTSPFVAGRLVTFSASLAVAAGIYGAAKKTGAETQAACLGALLFLFHGYAQDWGVMVNVDMTGIALNVAAFYCYQTHQISGKNKNIYLVLGILAGVLAFFTKSSMVASSAAFFVVLFLDKQYKKAGLFAAAGIFLILAVYAALNHLTQGQYFFHTTEIGHRLFFWAFIYRFWLDAFWNAPFLVLLGFYFIGSSLFYRRDALFFYFLLATILTFSLGKQGSDTNYLLEWTALSCVVAARLLSEPRIRRIALLLIFLQLGFFVFRNGDLSAARRYFEENRKVYDKISQVIKKLPGKILSTDMSLLAANGREVFYEPFPMGQMSYSGLWDDQIIVDLLNEKKFSMAILYFYAPMLKADRNFTARFMSAFKSNYRCVGRLEPVAWRGGPSQQLFFYIPNNSQEKTL